MAQATAETNQYVAPSGEVELLSWVKKKMEAGRLRIPDLQMRLSMAMVLGHQWAIWDKTAGQFRQPIVRSGDPNPPVRITANKIGSIVERSISKLTKQAPMPQARPVSDNDDDSDTARVSTRLIEHELDRLQWESLLTDFYFWPVTLGFSYIHVYWDAQAGKSVGKVEDKDVKLGNVNFDIVPAFELAVDPNSLKADLSDALWCVRTTSWTKEAVWEKWGKIPEGAEFGRNLADDVYALATSATGPSFNSKTNEDYVKVHQFWMRPSRGAPNGLVITWCGNTVLEKKEKFPYEHGQLPFVQFNLLPGLGTREGRTWVNDLIPLQIDYNDARSREATIRRLLTPKILAPTGSIDPQRVTARVEVITYAPTGEKPSMMIPDSGWIAQYEEGMKRADLEMGDRAGQSDVSSGRAAASQPAASILALQEADDSKAALSVKQMNRGIERVGWMILMLIKQFWTEERTVRAWSDKDGQLEMYHYSNADIANEVDVHISSESGIPRSQAARAQLALDLNQRGIPPFTDPQMLLRFIDMPGADIIMDAINIDTRQAHRENGLMITGSQVEVHHFDRHMVHLEEHNKVRKSVDYEQASPEIKAIIDAHCTTHEEQLAAITAAGDPGAMQMAGITMSQGGPGSPRDNINFKDVSPDLQRQMAQQSGFSVPKGESAAATGIGGPGQPGHVPGQTTESQMAHGATANK